MNGSMMTSHSFCFSFNRLVPSNYFLSWKFFPLVDSMYQKNILYTVFICLLVGALGLGLWVKALLVNDALINFVARDWANSLNTSTVL